VDTSGGPYRWWSSRTGGRAALPEPVSDRAPGLARVRRDRGDHPGTTTAEIILGAAGQDAAIGVARSFARRPLEVMREIAFAGELTAEGGAVRRAIDTGRIAVIGHSFAGIRRPQPPGRA
jgi:hypothetical protein